MAVAMVELAFIQTYIMCVNTENNMSANRHFIVIPSIRWMVRLLASVLFSSHVAFAQEQAALYMGPV